MQISLIIPIHNLEQYIGKCLQSIVRQRYDKSQYEIISVLDSCTDRSEAIVTTALENSGIAHTVLRTDCKSAGLSRNAGLEVAKGKYCLFTPFVVRIVFAIVYVAPTAVAVAYVCSVAAVEMLTLAALFLAVFVAGDILLVIHHRRLHLENRRA